MTQLSFRALSTFVAFFAIPVCTAFGQAGTLDASFAANSAEGAGKFVGAVGAADSFATGISVQPNGQILLAGTCRKITSAFDFCATRLNSDGTVDLNFGNGGKIITSIGDSAEANAIVQLPGGKFVLVGNCVVNSGGSFCAARYFADGSLDTSFGNNGRAAVAVGAGRSQKGRAGLIQPDGKLVIVGSCTGQGTIDFCSIRLDANGVVDPDYGVGGIVITPVDLGTDSATAVVLQPDSKLVLAGECSPPTGGSGQLYAFCAVRYLANGAFDLSFNGSGKTITAVSNANGDRANALTVQADGKLLLAGFCNFSGTVSLCLLRYNPDGSVDFGFANIGRLVAPIGTGANWGPAVAMQPDGKIVLSGPCQSNNVSSFCAARYHNDGAIDLAFGTSGTVNTILTTGTNFAYTLALQPDGKIIVAGWCSASSPVKFCAVRYLGGPFAYKNCSLDIDGDGLVLATTDALIHTRIALGITGPAVVNGINFPTNATRNSWPLIRDYLVTQCGLSLVQ